MSSRQDCNLRSTYIQENVNNNFQCTYSAVFVVIAGEGEKEVRKLTFAELRDRVAMYAAALKAVGVQKGDCVVGMSRLRYEK